MASGVSSTQLCNGVYSFSSVLLILQIRLGQQLQVLETSGRLSERLGKLLRTDCSSLLWLLLATCYSG